MDSPWDTAQARWVAPFGDPGSHGCSPLPRAFRSVPRPSSPLGAKASTRCPSHRSPTPSPKTRASAVRRTDVRCQTVRRQHATPATPALRVRLSDAAIPDRWPLEAVASASPLPRRRATGVICIPMPRHDRSTGQGPQRPVGPSLSCACFTVTTRFTMSEEPTESTDDLRTQSGALPLSYAPCRRPIADRADMPRPRRLHLTSDGGPGPT